MTRRDQLLCQVYAYILLIYAYNVIWLWIMTDRISPAQRSENMRRIRSANTSPELIVRRLTHRLGYRYRLHRKDLPGRPDLVFIRKRKAIFVHGCFWHQHDGCRFACMPKSNTDYWEIKLSRNVDRDIHSHQALEAGGWRVLTIWECETKDVLALEERLRNFLSGGA